MEKVDRLWRQEGLPTTKKLLKIVLFSLFFLFIASTTLLYLSNSYDTTITPLVSKQASALIVAWTRAYENKDLAESLRPNLDKCKHRCEIINRTIHELSNATPSAYIVHGPDMKIYDLPTQSSQYLIVLLIQESTASMNERYGRYWAPQDYFNATMTYKESSRYVLPYGGFKQRLPNDPAELIITKEQLLIALKKKTKGSLAFISHCETLSKREEKIKDLSRFTAITVRGKCAPLFVSNNTDSLTCRSNCKDEELKATHRFYLAFENSVCDDYITEKFYKRISELLVPVVLKRQVYKDVRIPPHSFIAVDDFDSTEKLGNYLNFLRKNDTAYLRHFDWTQRFQKPITYEADAMCKLCEDIHTRKKLILKDIDKFLDAHECENSSNYTYSWHRKTF